MTDVSDTKMQVPNEKDESSLKSTGANESQSVHIPRHTSFVNVVVCCYDLFSQYKLNLIITGNCYGLPRWLSLWILSKHHLGHTCSNHLHCQVSLGIECYSDYRWTFRRVRNTTSTIELH